MPHLFVNRPRAHHLRRSDVPEQFRWETINALLYKLGGTVLVAGSILFFPGFEAYADLGAWTFFGGSAIYLVVTGHDFAEVLHHRRCLPSASPFARLEQVAAATYLIGTLLFAIGSLFFLSTVGLIDAGAWCFVVASLLFAFGACINVILVQTGDTMLERQLMNYTAISFVVGSVLFMVASVPYLWGLETATDRPEIFAFLAALYLAGSALFLLGGFFNYWRAWSFVRRMGAAVTPDGITPPVRRA